MDAPFLDRGHEVVQSGPLCVQSCSFELPQPRVPRFEFLVQVPGVATSPLDDAALAAVLNWMLERFGRPQLPAKFDPYTAAEVGALRQKPLTNVDRVRAELIGAAAR